MSKVRYFKATDGKITVFRGSPTGVYLSAAFTSQDSDRGPFPRCDLGISFSGKPGQHPTVEITKAEYNALVAIKSARPNSGSPQDSWVPNSYLPNQGEG